MQSISLRLAGLLVITATLSTVCTASEPAKIRQGRGLLVTSSTLKWVSSRGRKIPRHAVPIGEDDVSKVWCRTKLHSIYIPGSLKDGACTVPFLGTAHVIEDDFDVLVSLNGSARVSRMLWDKYQAPPPNAIASGPKTLLALHISDDGLSHAGFLKPNDRRTYLVEDGKFVKRDAALVLVEDEPLRYELRDIILDEPRTEISPDEIELKTVTLLNAGSTRRTIVEPSTVTVRHLVYWGRVKGTVTGRNALVISPDGEQRHLVWGDQNELDRAHELELEAELPAYTGANARILATIRKTEAPYTGKLTAIYTDGGRLSRVIQGLHMDQRLIELKAVFSSPYFLKNKTDLNLPPVTQLLYKSTTTTTTTSTTTTTTPPPPLSSTDLSRDSDSGDGQPRSRSLSSEPEESSSAHALSFHHSIAALCTIIGLFVK